MQMFTGIDFILILIFFAAIGGGAARGAIGTLIDCAGIFFGLTVGSFAYVGPVRLFAGFKITGTAVEVMMYLFSCIFLTLAFILVLETLRKRVDLKVGIDRFFGGVLGIVNGLLLSSALLIVMSVSCVGGNDVALSKAAGWVVRCIPKAYEAFERKGLTLPKMILLPSGYAGEFGKQEMGARFIKFNFTKLKGATCSNCGGKVRFSGYFTKRGAALVPKFTCPQCGRTSDGCQTYEGFHAIYGACPVDLAYKGGQFDCGNWPNREWITPKGPCPLDGNTLDIFHWRSPVRY